MSDNLRIGIIGVGIDNGIGKWFAGILNAEGHNVISLSTTSQTTSEDVIKESDVVFLLAHSGALSDLIRSSRPEQLWVNLVHQVMVPLQFARSTPPEKQQGWVWEFLEFFEKRIIPCQELTQWFASRQAV